MLVENGSTNFISLGKYIFLYCVKQINQFLIIKKKKKKNIYKKINKIKKKILIKI